MIPTPQQVTFKEAVLSGTSNIRLDSVAGSGKTTALVFTAQDLPPSASTAAIAFNKRIADTLAKKMPPHVSSRTFNSIGHRAFGQGIGKRLTLNKDKMDELALSLKADWGEVFCANSAKVHGYKPSEVTDDWIEDVADLKDMYKTPRADKVRELLNASIQSALAGQIDFADQIYMSVRYSGVFDRHDFVLVDEAQDLSPLQMDMIKRMGRQTCRYSFIGDPNQAIYGFRGAGITSMDEAQERFSCSSLPLSVSFRCGKSIVRLAKEYVPRIESADTAPEASVEYRHAWSATDLVPGDVVLCRNNAPLVRLALRLYQQNIPARVLGQDVGMSLVRLLEQFSSCGDSNAVAAKALDKLFQDREFAQRRAKLSRVAQLDERIETIEAMLPFAPRTWQDWKQRLQSIFSTPAHNTVLLSSIHRAKGLEWPRVFFLDRSLIPNKRARLDWELQQEHNLFYVAVTRVVGDGQLIFINSEEMK